MGADQFNILKGDLLEIIHGLLTKIYLWSLDIKTPHFALEQLILFRLCKVVCRETVKSPLFDAADCNSKIINEDSKLQVAESYLHQFITTPTLKRPRSVSDKLHEAGSATLFVPPKEVKKVETADKPVFFHFAEEDKTSLFAIFGKV